MRRSPTTLALLLSTSLLFASGCSKPADDAAAPPAKEATAAASEAPANRLDANAAPNGAAASASDYKTPGIPNDVAPGVAFAYR